MALPVPPVEPVRDGLWSVPVVIPDNPLGYTLVYLFETPSGPVIVDNGWDDPRSWEALSRGVAETGHAVEDVYGVLLTHVHPDHHGLSARVRRESGAWIAMHPEDAWVVTRWRNAADAWLLEAASVMLSAGAPEDELASLPDLSGLRTREGRPELPALPTRLFADGDVVDVPGWTVRAVWTPGHSPGHTCFVVDDLLLAGDHVLPRISPHIGLYDEETDADPLGDYLASLRKLRSLDVSEVLPAHVARFAPLAPRLDSLAAHHEERLSSIAVSLAAGPLTTWDIAASMPWNRRWADIAPFMKRVALGEAVAHLRHLERRGVVERVPGAWPAAYRLVSSSGSAGAPGPGAP
jgi:glyoxylase-like metal-dependent hydrolase (beta-lactamase superfamily II)